MVDRQPGNHLERELGGARVNAVAGGVAAALATIADISEAAARRHGRGRHRHDRDDRDNDRNDRDRDHGDRHNGHGNRDHHDRDRHERHRASHQDDASDSGADDASGGDNVQLHLSPVLAANGKSRAPFGRDHPDHHLQFAS